MKKIIVFCFSIFFCSSLLADRRLNVSLSTSTSVKYSETLDFYSNGECRWLDEYWYNKYYDKGDGRYSNYKKEGTYIFEYDKDPCDSDGDMIPWITITWNNGKQVSMPIGYDNKGLAWLYYDGKYYSEDYWNRMD